MKKSAILKSFAIGTAGVSACAVPVAAKEQMAKERPNVVFILADDLGYGDLGCYGARNVATPNVDALANDGVRFTRCHATAATSTPSRYSILTGEYAWRRKDTDVSPGNAGMIIRPEQFTMADVFKNAGYSTAAIGKWHLGLGDKTGEQDWNAPLPAALADIGFDYSYIMAATADRVPCVFIENGKVANYDPSAPIEVNYHANFTGEPTGRDNPELLYNQKPSHGHDQSIVNGISRIGYMKGGGKALWKDENIADSITAHAVDFIRRNASQPFFLYFATNDVHVPRFPHERFRGASTMGFRGDAIAQFDWSVGRVLAELDSLGIADNTIVILTSDNGPVVDDGYEDRAKELLNGHSPTGGLRGGKYSAYEGGTRVPLIVRWPGHTPTNLDDDALISHIDLLASMAAELNVRIPRGHARDSYPRFDCFMATDLTPRPWVMEQAYTNTLGICTPEWKLIPASGGPPVVPWGTEIETGLSQEVKLFAYPFTESSNVAAKNPAVVERLETIMKAVKENDREELKRLNVLP